MKLSVTGTRSGLSLGQLKTANRLVQYKWGLVEEFHYGDCVGVDEQVLWLLVDIGYTGPLFIYPASVSEKWRANTLAKLIDRKYPGPIEQFERLPPFTRNGFIAEACDELWAFPGTGRGTWDCVRKAEGKHRIVVLDSGEIACPTDLER